MTIQASPIEGIKRAKVAMLGAPGVGKTSLVRRYVHSIFSDHHQTTLGVKVDRKTVDVGEVSVSLLLWDMHGETDGLAVPRNYLSGASAGILVYDRTRSDTFEVCLALEERLLEASPDARVYVVANKSDLDPDPAGLADAGSRTLIETSAKTGTAVEELFTLVATDAL